MREGQVTDLGGPWGEVEVDGLAWAQVRALFADEPAAWDAAKLASKAVAGREPRRGGGCTRSLGGAG